MNPIDWLLWLVLPGNLGRARTGLGDGSWNESQGFASVVRVGSIVLAVTVALVAPRLGIAGLADHALAIDAIAFVGVLLAWTLLPGLTSVRGALATRGHRERWSRRRPR